MSDKKKSAPKAEKNPKKAEKIKPETAIVKDSFWAIRQEPSPQISLLLTIAPIVIVFIIWFLLTYGNGHTVESRMVHPSILPSPMEMFNAIKTLLSPEKHLDEGIKVSLLRIGQGFLIALLIAFPLGILMGTFSKINKFFSPLIIVGSYIPIPTLLPLTMAWLGLGEEQKVGFLAIASFVFLLPAFVKAIDDVDDVFFNTGYTLGANKWQLLTKIIVPIAMPKLYDAMRAGFGVGFTWIIVAEMNGATSGLGYMLKQAQTRGGMDNAPIVYLLLIVIVLLAFGFDWLWREGSKLLFPYKEAR